jgi:hypothetical protein
MPDPTRAGQQPFPGRCVGGVCLILGPILLLTGALLRIQFHFFAPQQLQAYQAHPNLLTAAYSAYSMGWVALCFGILTLVHRIAAWDRNWAFWGGVLTLLGLFNRTFNAGVDHMAFQMASVLGADQAFTVVSDTYRAFHVFRYLNGSTMLGWPLLAIGAYRAGILGPVRALRGSRSHVHASLRHAQGNRDSFRRHRRTLCSACSARHTHPAGRSSSQPARQILDHRPDDVERDWDHNDPHLPGSHELRSACLTFRTLLNMAQDAQVNRVNHIIGPR